MPKRRKNSSIQRHKWRVTPCGLKHDMDPFYVGIAAAEFMPADPEWWFDAACAARMSFVNVDGVVQIVEIGESCPAGKLTADAEFLAGLLIGTVGGDRVLSAWMTSHSISIVRDGA